MAQLFWPPWFGHPVTRFLCNFVLHYNHAAFRLGTSISILPSAFIPKFACDFSLTHSSQFSKARHLFAMPVHDILESLGIRNQWVWGGECGSKSLVYAQAYGQDKTLIFLFEKDKQNPYGLNTRIVNCFHEVEVDPQSTFASTDIMRDHIWLKIASIWAECVASPKSREPGVLFRVHNNGSRYSGTTGCWVAESSWNFSGLVEDLLPLDQFEDSGYKTTTVDFDDISRLDSLGTRASTAVATIPSQPGTRFVYRGVDLRTYLSIDNLEVIKHVIDAFYNSIRVLEFMSPHANIQAPVRILVTVQEHRENYVIGSLEPYMTRGSLGALIKRSNKDNERIPIAQKAQWCYQMASAVGHASSFGVYHKDIKPESFLIDDESNLVLVSWEQNDVPVTTAAPEINGKWDAETLVDGTVKYTKYQGPVRRNMPEEYPVKHGWDVLDVYTLWTSNRCSKAVELAEVFSLGRTMWMLLRQSSMAFEHVQNIRDIEEEDWTGCDDVPEWVRKGVEKCLTRNNPNQRMSLEELKEFWDGAEMSLRNVAADVPEYGCLQ